MSELNSETKVLKIEHIRLRPIRVLRDRLIENETDEPEKCKYAYLIEMVTTDESDQSSEGSEKIPLSILKANLCKNDKKQSETNYENSKKSNQCAEVLKKYKKSVEPEENCQKLDSLNKQKASSVIFKKSKNLNNESDGITEIESKNPSSKNCNTKFEKSVAEKDTKSKSKPTSLESVQSEGENSSMKRLKSSNPRDPPEFEVRSTKTSRLREENKFGPCGKFLGRREKKSTDKHGKTKKKSRKMKRLAPEEIWKRNEDQMARLKKGEFVFKHQKILAYIEGKSEEGKGLKINWKTPSNLKFGMTKAATLRTENRGLVCGKFESL